jgi:hypothetical protein
MKKLGLPTVLRFIEKTAKAFDACIRPCALTKECGIYTEFLTGSKSTFPIYWPPLVIAWIVSNSNPTTLRCAFENSTPIK